MNSRKIAVFTLLAVLALVPLTFSQHGHHDAGKAMTVRGEVIDTACYMKHPDSATGEDHRECALMCTRKGVPMSVLDGEGHLYILVPDHSDEKAYDQIKEWAADQVEVSGTLTEQGGVSTLIVSASKKISDE